MDFKIKKPTAATHENWKLWHEQASSEEPLKYFCLETIPDWLDSIVWFFEKPWKDLKYWVRSHITRRWHVVPTHLKPGYYDKDTLLLHACFALLIDYVELELSTCNGVHERSPDTGLKYLDWEISETSGHQQEDAVVQKELYLWWKVQRPSRPEADVEYSALWDRKQNGENIAQDDFSAAAIKGHELEQQYYDEDSVMLKKLVDIRRSLWT